MPYFSSISCLAQSGLLKQRIGAGIKKLKIPRKINNPQRVAIAPLDVNASFINQHGRANRNGASSTRVYT